MAGLSSELLHASTVAIGGRAVLIGGPSGAGKSDLALRLVDRGAALVGDDYTLVRRIDGRLVAGPAANIAGRIEVRGLGIVALPFVADVAVALYVELFDVVDRMPAEPLRRAICGIDVPVMKIAPREASAPIKVELALARWGLAA